MEALNGQKGMFVNGKAMVEVPHHQGIYGLKFGKHQRQVAQSVHGSQCICRVRLQKNLLEVYPKLGSAWRRGRHGGKHLLYTLLSGGAELEPVFGDEVEESK